MCQDCIYWEYDEAMEEYSCVVNFIIDEDDFVRMSYNKNNNFCPYFRLGNEYTIVNKQK